MLKFNPHIDSIVERSASRLNILKALAGTSWGHQKETLRVTYNAMIKPIFTYACPIWFPHTSDTNISRLQSVQNKALRIISGSVQTSSVDHLHAECGVLPVKNELSMLCKQFAVGALRPNHPSREIICNPTGPRNIVPTLRGATFPHIQHLLQPNGLADPSVHRQSLSAIHTEEVAAYRNSSSRSANRVLGVLPPDISPDEQSLPRPIRTTLSQLRSGFSSKLQSYRHRIGLSDSSLCPECNSQEHTTEHVFACPAAPTPLTPLNLWTDPLGVADFLCTLRAFESLPPREGSPPRPPPEPPPAPPEDPLD